MMTLKQIMAKTPEGRIKKSEYCILLAVKTKLNDEGYPMVMAKVKSTHDHKGDPKKRENKYVCTVEVYPKRSVVVSCSCDDFLYTWEYTLAKRGAARIEYSNGQQSKDRNPMQIPGCCGHLYKLGDFLVEKGKL